MPTRDDDDLNVITGLSASRDEAPVGGSSKRADFSAQPNHQAEKQRSDNRQSKSSTPHAPNVRGSNRGFSWVTGLLMLGLVIACGWLGQQVFQLQQQLVDNNAALQQDRTRMESISAQVHETGSSFEETGNVLESKFKFFDSEIRKLWDVSNKRNKSAIDANTTLAKSIASDLKKAQQSLNNLSGNQSAIKKSLDQLNRQLVAENTALRATVDDQAEQLLLVRSEMDLLQKRFKGMPNDLATRVARNEEAVEAIDAGRRQLVERITQLQKRLDNLEGAP